MDKGAKIEYNTLMRKNEEGVALVRKKSGFENLVLISQLGLNVLTAVFLCVAAGVWADRQFGTSLTLPLLILGILAGGPGKAVVKGTGDIFHIGGPALVGSGAA